MRPYKNRLSFLCLRPLAILLVVAYSFSFGRPQREQKSQPSIQKALTIENQQVRCTVQLDGAKLVSDGLEALPAWASSLGGSATSIETDADFAIDLMYTDWDAPGKANNADNLITFTKSSFLYQRQETRETSDGARELVLYFGGLGHSIQLVMTYRLEPKTFYVKRNIALVDTTLNRHFVRFIWPRSGEVLGVTKVIKDGGFGQPVAVLLKRGGAFFGDEYPASDNRLSALSNGKYLIKCGAEMGERIGRTLLASDWSVEGITPDPYVKLWFSRYVDNIRVAPLRSFSLYNTWYDLRSPEYPRWSKDNVMGIETSLKMVDILRRNMIEKHHIQLDAFVLDDGWDVYKSDWVLRKEQWPNGLKPLADELGKTNTSLGVWIGPTGGYSFHSQRFNWMKEHGYETVGDMMCVAGKNYAALLRGRVSDFVQNDGVGYFKWDGIQFSCSEPNHGHPVDVYSRRAVLNSVASMSKAARDRNPNMFLNITSGTWMSPWWVTYANTIWMQGADYGFADVPSISSRDGSITYRDFVLYEDWKLKGLWFPISNLMTHGIIKGKNFSVGNAAEPLDKFTDDVLLYFARGVAMYELYISPDILSDGEWTSISRSMAWARKNFDVLMNTELVGGNPMKGETYAYVHYKGAKGIIAARNPVMEASKVDVELAVSQGLDPKASSLVLQRLYPTRWTSPKLYKAGDKITLPLDGFETAVYELFPIQDATEPLLAGAVYDVVGNDHVAWKSVVHSVTPDFRILNPSVLRSEADASNTIRDLQMGLTGGRSAAVVGDVKIDGSQSSTGVVAVTFTAAENAADAMMAVLLAQDNSTKAKTTLKVTAQVDGQDTKVSTEYQEGKSQWYTVAVTPGRHSLTLKIAPTKDSLSWQGKATAWFVAKQRQNTKVLEIALKQSPLERSLPPIVWQSGEVRKNLKLGEVKLSAAKLK
ncbi:MAG: alpha-galactosidase [Ignavibacteriales bacterium]|nr:alpha-galactosidase [Ignavibacteriales bacterium]